MTRILFFSVLVSLAFLSSCKRKPSKVSDKEYQSFPEVYIPVLDSTLMENSGIIFWREMLWTFNDSGGKNEIYALDAKTGKIKITLTLSNATNNDWEDIAQNENYLFIAETGNNAGIRTDLQILRLDKKMIGREPLQSIKVEKIFFNFTDQTISNPLFRNTSYDCEALFEWNDSLYVFTKDWMNFITKVYVMPNIPGEYSLLPIDSFNVRGLVTGIDINSKGKIALVGYQNFKSFVWVFSKTSKGVFDRPKFIDLGMLENAQTEGICFTPKGDLLISCEKTANYNQQVWKIGKQHFK